MSQPAVIQQYYFNELRKVCTGSSKLAITWQNFTNADFQGLTVRKIARIFLQFLPALIMDLARMIWHKISHRSDTSAQRAIVPAAALTPEQRQAHTIQIMLCVGREPSQIVLSYLDWSEVAIGFQLDSQMEGIVRYKSEIEARCGILGSQIQQLNAINESCKASGLAPVGLSPDKIQKFVPYSMTDEQFMSVIQLEQIARITNIVFLGSETTAVSVIAAAKKFGDQLTSIILANIHNHDQMTEKSLRAISEHCPNLKSIHLFDASFPHSPYMCAQLEPSILNLARKCTNLKSFFYNGYTTSNAILEALANHRTLTRLSLMHTSPRNFHPLENLNQGLQAIFQNCPLESVAFENVQLSDETVHVLAETQGKRLRSFHHMTKYYFHGISENAANFLAERCMVLESVEIDPIDPQNWTPSDERIVNFIRRAPHIRKLKIYTAVPTTIDKIIEICKFLKGLCISNFTSGQITLLQERYPYLVLRRGSESW